MIDCAEAVRRLWDYIENDLEPDDHSHVEEHLAFCRRCCGELEFAEELQRMLRSATRSSIPSEVEDRLLDVIDGLEEG